MSLEKDELVMLGRMEGKLDGLIGQIARQDQRMTHLEKKQDQGFEALRQDLRESLKTLEAKMEAQHKELDGRLRKVEQKAAVVGAVGGTAAGVGVAIMIEIFRSWLRGGGSGG